MSLKEKLKDIGEHSYHLSATAVSSVRDNYVVVIKRHIGHKTTAINNLNKIIDGLDDNLLVSELNNIIKGLDQ